MTPTPIYYQTTVLELLHRTRSSAVKQKRPGY